MPQSLHVTPFVVALVLVLSTGAALAEEPATMVAQSTAKELAQALPDANHDESPEGLSPLERGKQFLAEKKYDEAIKEFKAALELEPTTEAYVGIAMAKLRGRRVLQPGEVCDPAAFRAELKSLNEYRKEYHYSCWMCGCISVSNNVAARERELTEAVDHLESAAKLEPDSLAIHNKIVTAKIALSQYEEEAALRTAMGDVAFATESCFGEVRRMDRFELPSLMLSSEGMYPLELER